MAASRPDPRSVSELPPTPWDLRGDFFAVGGMIPLERARTVIPSDLEIVPVLPGMTMGAIGLARYGEGSTLTYSELVVVSGLVRSAGRVGGWISHIYVDDETSLAGGRHIWGLPKELATFAWDRQPEPRGPSSTLVKVSRHGRVILDFWAAPRWFGVPAAFDLPVVSLVEGRLSHWQARLSCRARLCSHHLEIPEESPFAGLLPRNRLAWHGENLHLHVPRPS